MVTIVEAHTFLQMLIAKIKKVFVYVWKGTYEFLVSSEFEDSFFTNTSYSLIPMQSSSLLLVVLFFWINRRAICCKSFKTEKKQPDCKTFKKTIFKKRKGKVTFCYNCQKHACKWWTFHSKQNCYFNFSSISCPDIPMVLLVHLLIWNMEYILHL